MLGPILFVGSLLYVMYRVGSSSPSASPPGGGNVFQTGLASWYGPGLIGNRTANGEIFTAQEFTAAHKTLKFGTVVEVRRTDTGASVTVRINDRGPFVEGRIIDLAAAAGDVLGLRAAGVARVELRIVRQP
jgi:rare lipoprotein A